MRQKNKTLESKNFLLQELKNNIKTVREYNVYCFAKLAEYRILLLEERDYSTGVSGAFPQSDHDPAYPRTLSNPRDFSMINVCADL